MISGGPERRLQGSDLRPHVLSLLRTSLKPGITFASTKVRDDSGWESVPYKMT